MDRQQLDYCRCETCPIKIGGKCLATIWNPKVIEWSNKRFGKSICYRCQDHQPVLDHDCKTAFDGRCHCGGGVKYVS